MYRKDTYLKKDLFKVRQSHPTQASSEVSTPASEENATTVLLRPCVGNASPSAAVPFQEVVVPCPGKPLDPEPKRSSPCGSARPSQIQASQHSTHTHLSTHTREIFPPTPPPTQLRNNLVLPGTSVDQKRTLNAKKTLSRKRMERPETFKDVLGTERVEVGFRPQCTPGDCRRRFLKSFSYFQHHFLPQRAGTTRNPTRRL